MSSVGTATWGVDMVRLVYSERGKLGAWRRYQLGIVEAITMWDGDSLADVIYVGHKHGWALVANAACRREMARKAGIRRPPKEQIVSLQVLSFECKARPAA